MLVAVLVILLGPSAAWPGLKEGLEAVRALDYETAYRELRPLADTGNVIAEFHLAWLYQRGDGVAKNEVEALRLFRRSAEGGYAPAQANLGSAFRRGHLVHRDYETALRWFQLAAERGEDTAMVSLAEMYEHGQGVERDLLKAIEWYRKAAELDHPTAQYRLGIAYWLGIGVRANAAEAYSWFKKGADQGYGPAMVSLATMILHADGSARDDVTGCAYLRLGIPRLSTKKDIERTKAIVADRCGSVLSDEERKGVQRRVTEWQPNDLWRDRQRRRFDELISSSGSATSR